MITVKHFVYTEPDKLQLLLDALRTGGYTNTELSNHSKM